MVSVQNMAGLNVSGLQSHAKSLIYSSERVISISKSLIEKLEIAQSKLKKKSFSKKNENSVPYSMVDRLTVAINLYESLNAELTQFTFDIGSLAGVAEYYEKVRQNLEEERMELGRKYANLRKEKSYFEEERTMIDKEREKLIRELGCLNKDYSVKNTTEGVSEFSSEEISKQLGEQIEKVEQALRNSSATELELIETRRTVKTLRSHNDTLDMELNATRRRLSKVKHHLAKCTCENVDHMTEDTVDSGQQDQLSSEESPSAIRASSRLLSTRSPRGHPILQRSCTAPVSKAKARLMLSQGDLLKANEVLVDGNSRLQDELNSLKQQNVRLTRDTNEARSAMYQAKNQLSVSITDREELVTKLQRLKDQNRQLDHTLRRQATEEVNSRRHQQQVDEQTRWKQMNQISVYGSNRFHHRRRTKSTCNAQQK